GYVSLRVLRRLLVLGFLLLGLGLLLGLVLLERFGNRIVLGIGLVLGFGLLRLGLGLWGRCGLGLGRLGLGRLIGHLRRGGDDLGLLDHLGGRLLGRLWRGDFFHPRLGGGGPGGRLCAGHPLGDGGHRDARGR